MRHTAVVFGEYFDLFLIDPDCVRKPDVVPHPVQFLHIRDGPVTELLQTELLFVFSLCQMCMEVHAIFTRQPGRLFHQIACNGEWRARRKDDLYHRAHFGIMVLFDQPLGILENGIFAVHD